MDGLLYGLRENVIDYTVLSSETGEVSPLDAEDEGITKHRNVKNYTPSDTASHDRRLDCVSSTAESNSTLTHQKAL